MKINNFIFLVIGLVIGALVTALFCNCFDKNTDIVPFLPPSTIDSSTTMILSNNYKTKIGKNTCDYKYSIVISNEQYEALKATEKLLSDNSKLRQVSGYRIFYGIEDTTSQTIKSFVFPMSTAMKYFDPNGKVFLVDLQDDRYSLPCPKFCD